MEENKIKLSDIAGRQELDEFDIDEQLGRLYFAGWAKTNPDIELIQFDKRKWGEYDVIYMSGATRVYGEIKFRKKYNHNDYIDWMLQDKKLKAMQELNQPIHYINIYRDYGMRIWDITTFNGIPTTEYHAKTSSEDNGKKDKLVHYLPSSTAIYTLI